MTHEVPSNGWPVALAHIVRRAADGDTILCHSEAMASMGKRALSRKHPGKTLVFTVKKEVAS